MIGAAADGSFAMPLSRNLLQRASETPSPQRDPYMMMHVPDAWRLRRASLIVAAIVATLAIVAVAWRPANRTISATRPRVPHASPVLPVAPRPIPEPMKVAALTPDQARASNAAVPLAPHRDVFATPFVYGGSGQDRAAARSCLAAAVYYEAGDDAVGEQAVAQVILNRLRHPAFPKTICGVVFQGSARDSGCQFTFSCDGSLARTPPAAAWARARAIADAALTGFVARGIGWATYYHADWVVPYWRDTLDKIAVVHGQIFYRWRGPWGRSAAFSGRALSPEWLDPKIAALADPAAAAEAAASDDDAGPARTSLSVAGVSRAALKGAIVRLKDDDAGQYVLQLAPNAPAGTFAVTAFTICADRPDCLILAWADERDVPRTLPVLPIAMRTMAFMYRKSSLLGDARPYWDCRRYPRSVRGQCLPGSAPLAVRAAAGSDRRDRR